MKYPAPALAQGLQIIEHVVKQKQASFGELQKLTGINPNTLNRCIITLCGLGYITKQADGKYAPGLRLFVLEGAVNVYQQLKARVRPELERIVAHYGVTSILHGVQGERIYVLDKVMSPTNLTMNKIGEELTERDEHLITPWGMIRLMALGVTAEELHPQLREALEGRSSLGVEAWLQLYVQTCETGCCDDACRIRPNLCRMAVPLYGPEGGLIGVLGIGSYPGFLTAETHQGLLADLAACGKALSAW